MEKASDVLEELTALTVDPAWTGTVPGGGLDAARDSGPELDGEYQQLLDCMGYDPVSVDALVERSGLTAEAVSSMLLLLELRGCVSSLTGGLYAQVSRGS